MQIINATSQIFKPIPSCPNYFASNSGHIWRDGRSLKEGNNGRGYLNVGISLNGKVETKYVHRLVAEAFFGSCPPELECRHLDGNRKNNKAENLIWSDKETNEADKIRHGTVARGEKNPGAKLTEKIVLEARARTKAGESIKSVAASLGFGRHIIGDAIVGRRWKHLPDPLPKYSTRRKFNEQQVKEIRRRSTSESRTALAKEFGVAQSAISWIVLHKSYSHIG